MQQIKVNSFEVQINNVLRKREKMSSHEQVINAYVVRMEKKSHNRFYQSLLDNIDKDAKEVVPTEKEVGHIEKGHMLGEETLALNNKKIKTNKEDKEQQLSKKLGEKLKVQVDDSYQAAMLRIMYQSALKEYGELKARLANDQFSLGDPSYSKEAFNELVEYEWYLSNCANRYRSYTNIPITSDEEVQKLENKVVMQNTIDRERVFASENEYAEKMTRLAKRLDTKANEILKYKQKSEGVEDKIYIDHLTKMEDEYIDIYNELGIIRPNVLQLFEQEEEAKIQQQFLDKKSGMTNPSNTRHLEAKTVQYSKEVSKKNNGHNMEGTLSQIGNQELGEVLEGADNRHAYEPLNQVGKMVDSVQEIANTDPDITDVSSSKIRKTKAYQKDIHTQEDTSKIKKELKGSVEPEERVMKADMTRIKKKEEKIQEIDSPLIEEI